MSHYVFAFSDLLLATAFLFIAYIQFTKNNFRLAAFLLVLAAFTIRVYVASDLFLHEWDERYHALVAKNLMDNLWLPKLYPIPLLSYNMQEWSSNFIWLHKQPLPLWCMAISMKIFGVNEWALRLPSVIISSMAVYLTYLIGKKLFSQKIGLLAAFFHAINGLMIEMTAGRIATDHIDVFFFFFVEAGVLCSVLYFEKRKMFWNILTGICIGLAVLCKWLPAFIVIAVWLVLNYNKSDWMRITKGWLVIIISACVVFVPWQIYIQSKFPAEYTIEMSRNYRHITQVLDGQGGSIFYFFNKLFITLNEFIWVAFVWFCYKAFQKDTTKNRIALLLWVVIPFIFFSFIKTKMQGYLLFTYPALFIMLAGFCIFLVSENSNAGRMKFQRLIFIILLFLSIRYSIERIKPMQNQSKQIAWANDFKNMNKAGADKRVYVNVKHYIEGMFYTNSIMYQYIPSQQQIDELKAKGYEVIVNQNPEL